MSISFKKLFTPFATVTSKILRATQVFRATLWSTIYLTVISNKEPVLWFPLLSRVRRPGGVLRVGSVKDLYLTKINPFRTQVKQPLNASMVGFWGSSQKEIVRLLQGCVVVSSNLKIIVVVKILQWMFALLVSAVEGFHTKCNNI